MVYVSGNFPGFASVQESVVAHRRVLQKETICKEACSSTWVIHRSLWIQLDGLGLCRGM